MFDLPRLPSLRQRLARGLMVASCAVLAIGLLAAAAIREKVPPRVSLVQPARTPGASVQLAAAELAPVDPSPGTPELLRGIEKTAASPMDSAVPVATTATSARPSARKVWMEVTAYCPCPLCCGAGASGFTASGRRIGHNGGRFVAADPRYKFGTRLLVPGYSEEAVEVIDRGGSIKGNRLDVFFPTHQQAVDWGRRWVQVSIEP